MIISASSASLRAGARRQEEEQRFVLHFACKRGSPDAIESVVRNGGDIEMRNARGRTALMDSARHGRVSAAQKLLELKADVHAENHSGRSAIHFAISPNEHACAMIDLLVAHKANVDARDALGQTPLMHAATRILRRVARHLILQHGTSVRAVATGGETALHLACTTSFSHAKLIELLLFRDADVNALDVDRMTPIHRFARNGNSEKCMRLLLNAHADAKIPDAFEQSPLTSIQMRSELSSLKEQIELMRFATFTERAPDPPAPPLPVPLDWLDNDHNSSNGSSSSKTDNMRASATLERKSENPDSKPSSNCPLTERKRDDGSVRAPVFVYASSDAADAKATTPADA